MKKHLLLKKSIANDVYPIDLFEKHINSSIYIQIIQGQHDTNNYSVTLYSNNFYINLDRSKNIYNDNNMDEFINITDDVYTIIIFHTIDFYKGTVRLKQDGDRINEKVDSLN